VHSTIKTAVFWGVIVFSAFLLWQTVAAKPSARSVPEISYSEFLTQVESGSVIKVTISQNQVNGHYRDNGEFRVIAPTSQEGMLQTLHQKSVEIWFTDKANAGWLATLSNLLPLVLLGALWLFMIRRMKSQQVQPQPDGTVARTDSRWSRK
jgi:cell division protease FtsH